MVRYPPGCLVLRSARCPPPPTSLMQENDSEDVWEPLRTGSNVALASGHGSLCCQNRLGAGHLPCGKGSQPYQGSLLQLWGKTFSLETQQDLWGPYGVGWSY